MALPKWNDERTAQLVAFVGDETPVSQETVAGGADQLETSSRSISSKLRKMGYEVELASARASKSFSPDQEAVLRTFIEDNSCQYTYAEIAGHFEDGAYSPKSIQGKILSMELTSHVKAAPKVEATKMYTDDEEQTFLSMVAAGAFVEEIAAKLGRQKDSIRGKALSLLRAGQIDAIPRQETTKGGTKVDPFVDIGDITSLTVEEIAEQIGKTARGVKTMLTRRGLVAADYDGAAKAAKAAD